MLSNIQNNQNSSGINSDFGINFKKNEPYYAKKGEPIYQKDMDSDEDGIVTFDEFRDYCKENDVPKYKVDKMLKSWAALRSIQSISEDSEEYNHGEFVYSKKGDFRYDNRIDKNSDEKITYQEYMQYYKDHAQIQKSKLNIQAYLKETNMPKGTIDEEA